MPLLVSRKKPGMTFAADFMKLPSFLQHGLELLPSIRDSSDEK